MNRGVPLQRRQDHFADAARDGMVLRQLRVVLGSRGLMTGGDAAVDPVGGREQLARLRHLLGREDVRDLKQHGT